MFFFWYCFDEHLATIFSNAALGHIPWWMVLVAHLVLLPFMGRSKA
jgi:hypothetical protein